MKHFTLERIAHSGYEVKDLKKLELPENRDLNWIYIILDEIDDTNFVLFLKWLVCKDEKHVGSNSLFFEKVDGNIRVVSDFDSDKKDEELSYQPFIMTKKSFEDMIENWNEKVLYKRPSRVRIYWDGGKVSIKPQKGLYAYLINLFYRLHFWRKIRQLSKKG